MLEIVEFFLIYDFIFFKSALDWSHERQTNRLAWLIEYGRVLQFSVLLASGKLPMLHFNLCFSMCSTWKYFSNRHLSRFFDCLGHPNLSTTLATDQKWPLSHLRISYQSLAVSLTIVLISGISTMVNGTLLNFGKRYEDNLRVIFDQWSKLHLGLDALSNQKILNGI